MAKAGVFVPRVHDAMVWHSRLLYWPLHIITTLSGYKVSIYSICHGNEYRNKYRVCKLKKGMTTIADIYKAALPLINQELRKEMVAQGHHLTGDMEDSLDANISKEGKADVMQGVAVLYTKFVNEGFPPEKASFKQFPFLLEYFIKRGYPVASTSPGTLTAPALAAMTIRKWMKEGMPTQASKRFSSTGSRTNMIENAFVRAENKIDEVITNGIDFLVEERFQKEKSETI